MSKKVYLMIIDGLGEGKVYPGNAIANAQMPNLRKYRQNYPWTLLKAHGEAVGLPEDTQGGSEVGHFTIGAGRVVFQTLEEINRTIKNGDFYKKAPFLEACKKVKSTPGAALHLLGMISDQGVHAHLNHLYALLEIAKNEGVSKIYIHAITDGRDVPERSANQYLQAITNKIHELKMSAGSKTEAKIATIIGRYYAMDRDQNWDRTQAAYDLYAKGNGKVETDPLTAIENAYSAGVKTDYYIEPTILDQKGLIKNIDSVIFFNFRTDRTRQITHLFTGETTMQFKDSPILRPYFVCFGDYSKTAPVVFPTKQVTNNLGTVIEQNGLNQLRIAETEKYAHVTYFFDSQIETNFPHGTKIMINSPKTKSYAEKPEMSAHEVTDEVIKTMNEHDYSLIVQNFANTDLVGHSGDYTATIKACEVIDECIGKIAEATLKNGYDLIITGDHGNAEYMIYEENGQQCPSHTKNPVIFLLISKDHQQAQLKIDGSLQDIAPTILNILNIKQPQEMTGTNLIK